MKTYRFLFLALLLSLHFNVVNSQGLKKNKVVEIDGVKYVMHNVKPGETISSLCREYKIESRDLIKSNPNLSRGLKTGDILRIPYSGNESPVGNTVANQNDQVKFIIHEIKRRETPFFISKKYGISIDDIYKYNPGIKKFKRGEKIRIPQFNETPSVKFPNVEPNDREVSDKPGNYEMIEYRVKPDETLTSISKLYNLSINEILLYNPNAQHLKIGMILKLPNKKAIRDTEVTGGYFFHTIESGETLYGLTKKYNISESELKELNPILKNGFPAGVRIKIPEKQIYEPKAITDATARVKEIKPENEVIAEEPDQKVETVVVPEGCRPANRRGNFSDTYHIALLLPLYLDANDSSLNFTTQSQDTLTMENLVEVDDKTDTLETQVVPGGHNWTFYGRSENFLHFYEGVLLAIDSMRNRGMNVKLHVYDTGQDRRIVENLITTDEFLNLDLIIGPIYPDLQKPVSDFAFKNRIPMVSPLSPDGRLAASNPYYFQVFPTQEFLMQKTAQYIADEYYNSNFIVLQTGKLTEADNQLVDVCREKLSASSTSHNVNNKSFRIYDFNSLGGGGIPQILSKTKENVFIIPSVDEGQVSVGVSNINNNSTNFEITVIGNSRYKQFESINQEYFHNTKLKYFYPYWTDFNSPTIIRFFSKFRYYFDTEPTQYSMQGYDVAFFFLSAFWDHGKNFYNCLPYMNVPLTQGNYKFEKVSNFGGFINKGVSLISYTKDYTIVREKLGEVKFIYK